MSGKERMLTLRAKRKEKGLKELRFWVREVDLEEATKVISVFQKLAFLNDAEEQVKVLELWLKRQLEDFRSWENYLREKYDFNLSPSTEKQRKLALRIATSAEEEIPEYILKHKGLLSGWIKEKYKVGYSG